MQLEASTSASRAKTSRFMKKNLKKLTVRDITSQEVLALWREGKLYTEAEENVYTKEQCREDALKYVASVEGFVAQKWKSCAGDLWEAIVGNKMLSPQLIMKKKRELNKYCLTAIVYDLQNRGVYEPVERVDHLKLHLLLEHTTKQNRIYKNWDKYCLDDTQQRELKRLLSKFSMSIK